jgi:hypothetical protein
MENVQLMAEGKESANSLYNKYKGWAKTKGEPIMPFPTWIKWAKEKKLLSADGNPNYSADNSTTKTTETMAQDTTGTTATDTTKKDTTKTPAAHTSGGIGGMLKTTQGKVIAGLLLVTAVFFIYKAAKKKK